MEHLTLSLMTAMTIFLLHVVVSSKYPTMHSFWPVVRSVTSKKTAVSKQIAACMRLITIIVIGCKASQRNATLSFMGTTRTNHDNYLSKHVGFDEFPT